jgi:hypothetical protein
LLQDQVANEQHRRQQSRLHSGTGENQRRRSAENAADLNQGQQDRGREAEHRAEWQKHAADDGDAHRIGARSRGSKGRFDI